MGLGDTCGPGVHDSLRLALGRTSLITHQPCKRLTARIYLAPGMEPAPRGACLSHRHFRFSGASGGIPRVRRAWIDFLGGTSWMPKIVSEKYRPQYSSPAPPTTPAHCTTRPEGERRCPRPPLLSAPR